MYYEAKLYIEPEIKFEVNEVPDAVAEGWAGVVSFANTKNNVSGYKAYGETKWGALDKLEKYTISEIKELESKITHLKKLL